MGVSFHAWHQASNWSPLTFPAANGEQRARKCSSHMDLVLLQGAIQGAREATKDCAVPLKEETCISHWHLKCHLLIVGSAGHGAHMMQYVSNTKLHSWVSSLKTELGSLVS